MSSVYKTLPAAYSWTGIKVMSWAEVQARFRSPDRFFAHTGSYFQVSRQADIVLKVSRDDVALLNQTYLNSPLLAQARDDLQENGMHLLRESFRYISPKIKDAYLRSKVDELQYLALQDQLGERSLVEQSIGLAWAKGFLVLSALNEIMIQPYVPGTRVSDMIMDIKRDDIAPRLEDQYSQHIPFLGPQLRAFLDLEIVDPSPLNFIFTPEGRVIYIDYQPVSVNENLDRNRYFFDWMLREWGY